MRHYFKEKNKGNKLFEFAEKNGADYFEDGKAVWKKPTIVKGRVVRAAVRLNSDGDASTGYIDESCDNFNYTNTKHSPETQKWLIEMLTLFQKFKP